MSRKEQSFPGESVFMEKIKKEGVRKRKAGIALRSLTSDHFREKGLGGVHIVK